MLKRVYLEITNVCNLACSFCPGTKRQKRFMSETEFAALTEKLRGKTQYLYFHLMGEPLLHPLLGRFLAIAEEKGFRVILTTNGTLLNEKGQSLPDAPALYKINLSLQSFEANEGGRLEDYVNQCARFAAKAAAKGKICELRLWNRGGRESLNGEILRLLEETFPAPWEESPRSVNQARGTCVPGRGRQVRLAGAGRARQGRALLLLRSARPDRRARRRHGRALLSRSRGRSASGQSAGTGFRRNYVN